MLPHRYGNSHATWDHTVLPATRQRWHSRPYPSRSWYSIKRPRKLSWPRSTICLCLSEVGVLSKGMNGLIWFLARRLLSTSTALCFNGTSLGNLFLYSGLRKLRHGILIVETCYQLGSRKADAQSLKNWTVVGQPSWRYLRAPTLDHWLVYRRDRQALSTARFCRAGQLATADSCFVQWISHKSSDALLVLACICRPTSRLLSKLIAYNCHTSSLTNGTAYNSSTWHTACSLSFHSSGLTAWIPQTFTVTSEHIRSYFLVFLFYTFSCRFPCGRLSWLMSAFERTL